MLSYMKHVKKVRYVVTVFCYVLLLTSSDNSFPDITHSMLLLKVIYSLHGVHQINWDNQTQLHMKTVDH